MCKLVFVVVVFVLIVCGSVYVVGFVGNKVEVQVVVIIVVQNIILVNWSQDSGFIGFVVVVGQKVGIFSIIVIGLYNLVFIVGKGVLVFGGVVIVLFVDG